MSLFLQKLYKGKMIKEKNINFKKVVFSDIPQMNHLYQNLFSRGKALRAVMTSQVSSYLDIPKEKTETLSRIVEYIHQSSILHDDVIDMSPIRRGALSSWMQYSMKRAILAGDYLLAQAAGDTAELENIALMKITSDVLKKLVKGEWMQDSLKNQADMQGLQKVHELKTASLFQWSLRAPFLVAHRYDKELHNHLDQIGLIMGFLFQRADDLLDFNIRNTEDKSVFKDVEEGYFNSFAVYLLKDKDNDFKTFLQKSRSLSEVKSYVGKEEFKNTLDSFDEMNQKLIEECEKKIGKLKLLKKEEPLISILKQWPQQLYWRKSV